MTEYRRTDDGIECPEREQRTVSSTGLELRAEDGKPPTLSGYALVYENRYDIGDPSSTGFTETIARGAAAKSAGEADVRLLVNHTGVPLARTKSGTLRLESDDIGLRVDAELDPTNPVVAEIRSAMSRGDLDQMSFAFKAIRQNFDTKTSLRTINELKLYDVSIVTFPANPATVAQIRETADEAETATTEPSGRSLELARRQLEVVSHG